MHLCHPRFEPLLRPFSRPELERAESSVYGLWPNLELAYANPAWFRFAEENGGEPEISRDWGLGVDVSLAIELPLRGYFRAAFERCAANGVPWTHEYDCHAPTLERHFHMRVYPLGLDEGFLVVHSLVSKRPQDETEAEGHDGAYVDDDGLILQCIHCRRIRRSDDSRQWDWVPTWVQIPPHNASGGLCPHCHAFHFGEARRPRILE